MADPILWGLAGGVVGEFLNIYDHRKEDPKNWPGHLRRFSYWAIAVFMVALGGVLVAAHQDSGVDMNAILAMNIGLTAPLALKTSSRAIKPLSPGTTDQDDVTAGGAPASSGNGSAG